MAKPDSPLDRCPRPDQLAALIVWLESHDDQEPEDRELVEWLSQFLPEDDLTEN